MKRDGNPFLASPRNAPARSIAILVLLFLTSFVARSQSFQNFDFESPTFIPVGSGYQGEVDPASAIPGWTAYWGTNLAPFILHDNEFLDSEGISILDTNAPYGFQLLHQTLEGDYTLLLQGGFSLDGSFNRVSAAIAQTGEIPSWARSLTFLVSGSDFNVSVGGRVLPVINGDSVDISAFAGKTEEIRFTALPKIIEGPAINFVYLDDVCFSTTYVPEPAVVDLLPVALLAFALFRFSRRQRMGLAQNRPEGKVL